METKHVPEYDVLTADHFFEHIYPKRIPALFKQINTGSAKDKWTVEYLSDALHSVSVKAHVSKEPKLDFISKNFSYKLMKFGDFINKCSSENDEYLYLRSIGDDKYGRDVSHIEKHFPQIADDFQFPPFIESLKEHELYFSSVLRISSKNLNLWTHYDIMDNVLVNVKGTKRVTLFSPEDVPFLYVVGDKSKITDIDAPLEEIKNKFPLFLQATRYECILEEGSALFIPSLWFHNVFSQTFAISVNIFWKDEHVHDFYDKKDVYGNKDLTPAMNGFTNIDKALKHIETLPEKYKRFYKKLYINKIQQTL